MNKGKKIGNGIPKYAKKLSHNHLAEGEVTGHFHAANGATLYADESTDTVYADAPEGASITHQEHKEFTIPAGVYTRHIVQEFDHANELYKIDNAEVRREFVRKIGYELLCQRLGARVIDAKIMRTGDGAEHPYELIGLKAPDNGGEWLFLKMTNPSIGTFHVEGVSNECKTVDEALRFRNAAALAGKTVCDDGAEWYQQGDVILMPAGATRVRPFPVVLT